MAHDGPLAAPFDYAVRLLFGYASVLFHVVLATPSVFAWRMTVPLHLLLVTHWLYWVVVWLCLGIVSYRFGYALGLSMAHDGTLAPPFG